MLFLFSKINFQFTKDSAKFVLNVLIMDTEEIDFSSLYAYLLDVAVAGLDCMIEAAEYIGLSDAQAEAAAYFVSVSYTEMFYVFAMYENMLDVSRRCELENNWTETQVELLRHAVANASPARHSTDRSPAASRVTSSAS